MIALGLADRFLLVRFLAVEGSGKPRRAKVSAVMGVAWALVVAVLGYAASRELPELDTAWIVGAAALNGVLARALFQRSGMIVVATLTAALAGSTLWFNPIARGGSAYLRDNPLSQALLAIDAEAGRGTRWAAFNTNAGLLPVLGLGTLSGTFPVPQWALWSRLDPVGSFRNIYDRYAHVILRARSVTPRRVLHDPS